MTKDFCCLGAYIFINIESPAEEHRYLVKRLRAKDIEDTMGYVAKLLLYEMEQNLTEKQWEGKVIVVCSLATISLLPVGGTRTV